MGAHTICTISCNECSCFMSPDASLSVKRKRKRRLMSSMSEGEFSRLQHTEGKRKQGDDHTKGLRTFNLNKEGKRNGRKEQRSGSQITEVAEDHREISSLLQPKMSLS